jgi:hypothetical protein
MKKQFYVIMSIERALGVTVGGLKLDNPVPMNWADGMYGALPVFTSKKAAKKYAGAHNIIAIERDPKPSSPKEGE